MAFKNGHYVDSGLSQEERDKIDAEMQKRNSELTSWDDVPVMREDQETE